MFFVIASPPTSYAVDGLNANTTYQFSIEAFNADGTKSALSPAVRTLTTSPTAPTNVVAVVASATQVRLSWTDVAQETGYRLYQTTAGVEQLIATLAANTTQFTVNGLVKETAYRFRIAAFNLVGETSSAPLNVTTLTEAPAPIRNVTAVAASSNEVQVTWSDTTGETKYWVYQWDGKVMTLVATLAANSTSFRVTGLLAKTNYQFTVLAANSGGTVQSAWVAAKTL